MLPRKAPNGLVVKLKDPVVLFVLQIMEQKNNSIFKSIIILVIAAVLLVVALSVSKKTTPAAPTLPEGETTFTGTSTCLPHKDTTGPQTLECAFGLKGDDGLYYALDTNALAPESVAPAQSTDNTIVVTGTLVPVNTLNSDQWQKYNIVGIIQVKSIGVISSADKTAAVDWNALLGKWTGVEGTLLTVSKNADSIDGDTYTLAFVMLDGPVTVTGRPVSDGIQFTRDGKTYTLHPGNGEDTGMKYLVDKKNCVVVETGEGYCKD